MNTIVVNHTTILRGCGRNYQRRKQNERNKVSSVGWEEFRVFQFV